MAAPPPGSSSRIVKAAQPKQDSSIVQIQRAASEVTAGLEKVARLLSGTLTEGEAMTVYDALRGWGKNIEQIKRGANEAMKQEVKARGSLVKGTDDRPEAVAISGHHGGRHFTAEVETSYKKKPDDQLLRELLASKGEIVFTETGPFRSLDLTTFDGQNKAAYDEVVSHEPNMTKIQALIKRKIITQEEWDKCRPVHQERLKIKES